MHGDILVEKTLYRILEGRLRFKRGDLLLYIYEPSRDILMKSLDVYDEAYDKAYMEGVYVESEILNVLVEQGIWTPLDDREAKKIEKEIEDLKVQAFQSYLKVRQLSSIKRHIKERERHWVEVASRKTTLDHTTCEGIAAFARQNWLIYKTTTLADGGEYDWKLPIAELVAHCKSNIISAEGLRSVARSSEWRARWIAGKESDMFGVPYCDITPNQAHLCSFSRMYDSVYEHPESPEEEVVKDDVCLDGWFIHEKRKSDKEKQKAKTEAMIGNEKISNSGEIFVVASDKLEAENVYDLNNPLSRGTVKQRQAATQERGRVKHTDFADVQQDLNMQRTNALKEKFKGNR